MNIIEKGVVKNRGSAIVEMTLLIPILLGVIYLYIMLFLFLVQSGKCMGVMADALYSGEEMTATTTKTINLSKNTQGNKVSIFLSESTGKFDIELQMHRKEDTVVRNIRRWQLAADTLRAGTDE